MTKMGKDSKPIKREFTCPGHQLPLIVTLGPGDIVTMREKGKRTEFTASIGWLYLQIVKRSIGKAS